MGTADVEIVDSWVLDPVQLGRLYDDVLAPSFPSGELVARSELVRRLGHKEDSICCRVAVHPGGQALAAIVADMFAKSGVLLLSYLAVRPGLRGRGLGTELAADAVPRWISRHEPSIALAEVEDPRYHAVDTDHGDPTARLELYARLGAHILPLPYVQPALAPGSERVRNLLLTVFYTTPEALTDPTHVASALLVRFLTEYFDLCEGSVPVDEEFTELLAACQRSEGIPLKSAADYLG